MIRLRIQFPEAFEGHKTVRGLELTLGREASCGWSLPEVRGLSRRHLRIHRQGDDFVIEDLDSHNGTWVAGQRIQRRILREGDHVKAGQLRFVVEALSPHAESTAKLDRRGEPTPADRRSRSIRADTFEGYRLIRKLGAGGMGIVFEALEDQGQRSVALKVLRPHLARNEAYLARFIEEIRVLTSISHPAIVQVYGRGSAGDLHYLTMELVRGVAARQAMRDEGGRFDPHQALRISYEAAMALNAAHQQAGILHGDVKPGNLLIDGQSRVKICDFGLAVIDFQGKPRRGAREEDERRGTAAYAAPERFASGGRPTVGSDIYSLGISLHQMLTGLLPFRSRSVAGYRDQHRDADIPLLPESLGPFQGALQMLVERMMAKKPTRRYDNYPELIQDMALIMR